MALSIGIIGTRGIPNNYGGFEQFAEYLSLGLVEEGYDITVYNTHDHLYKENVWNGVRIIHCHNYESKLGTMGQFFYDLNCILNCRKQNFDIILQLGYTSNSIWGWLLPSTSIVTTNMDGLEWKRTKYSKLVRYYLKWAEKLGVYFSDYLISDSTGIQSYLKEKYNKNSTYIPYGATVFKTPDKTILDSFNIIAYEYNLLIARLEPENSIETILDGVTASHTKSIFLVIGNYKTKFGQYLQNKYISEKNIKFCGTIYNIDTLNNLRYYSNIYFHGHTVGGTNPSLLEAMASSSLIAAHNNLFNKSILNDDAFFLKMLMISHLFWIL